jgi:DNA polymerase III alpha subunit
MESAFEKLLRSVDKSRLTPDLYDWAVEEIVYLECNPADAEYLLEVKTLSSEKAEKPLNINNSTMAFLCGITDQKPKSGIKRTATSPPDFDFDTNARDELKAYLIQKYGKDHVVLLGTYNTLKTKGAIKDVCKYLRPAMTFDEVQEITKRFILNRNDFDKEIDFFLGSLQNDPFLTKWFDENLDVKEAVISLLGTARSSGIHAGGIVLSSADVKQYCALTYDADEGLYVTQPEMSSVETIGLIKNDFLGLLTLGDFSRCMRLISERRGVKLKLATIELDEADVLEAFKEGNTLSVFQFNTPLATDKVSQMNAIGGVRDLAMITSLARRGPLNMGMDKVFIARANGEEELSYPHPAIESVLKDSYGVIIYQEQVMSICKILGDFTGDEALTVMKAMGKKKFSVLASFKGKFLEACDKKRIERALSQQIWDLMESFAEYGFNKSHAIAYSAMSYLCMWFKIRFPLEWKTAVLMGAKKEDFKKFYSSWKEDIIKPDINDSKAGYLINAEDKIVMPFTSINGIGPAVVPVIVSLQPCSSFEDYYRRAAVQIAEYKKTLKRLKKEFQELPMDARRIKLEEAHSEMNAKKTSLSKALSKQTIESLILSGCFDRFKKAETHDAVYRKELIKKMIELKHSFDKPSKKELAEDTELVATFERLPRKEFLFEELKLLNFTSFDYFEFFGDSIYSAAKRQFNQDLLKPDEALERKDGETVVVAGAVESIKFFPTKTGKNKGKEMCKIILSHNASSIEVTVFPATLERDDNSKQVLRRLRELHPFMVKGKLNAWNDMLSVIYDSGLNMTDQSV